MTSIRRGCHQKSKGKIETALGIFKVTQKDDNTGKYYCLAIHFRKPHSKVFSKTTPYPVCNDDELIAYN